MPALVQIAADGQDLLFEGEFSDAELREVGWDDKLEDVIKATDKSINSVAATIRTTAVGLATSLRELAADKAQVGSISGFEIEMGIKITGEGNVIVAKGTAEGNLRVKVTWDLT